MNRKEIKEQEFAFLATEFKKNPELFTKETHVDDTEFLEKIGISLPTQIQKNLFPGYIKLWPQDFIVEEILKDGSVQTVTSGQFLKEGIDLAPRPTYWATLVKCGLSTIEAIEEISSLVGVDKKKIQFAGIKDKDALTAQHISLRDVPPEKVISISSPYFFLKNVYGGKGAMEVGGLQGNKFTIVVRTDDSFKKDHFLENVGLINKEGFFNFFYSQRFGNPRLINWFWGLLILRGDYERAVASFLCSEGQRETPYFKKIREHIKESLGDWKTIEKILEPFPLILQNELKVVRHLKNNPTDFVGALGQLPEQVQLWVYAYGSLLFNRKLSKYIQQSKKVPEKIPLILSKDKKDWMEYQEFLKEDGITQLPFENLRPFNFIQWKKREIATKERVNVHHVEVTKEGVVISFSLPKGCYATTFLCHLFSLVSGMPPNHISDEKIDSKKILEGKNLQDTLEKFAPVIFSKKQDLFEKLE